MMRSSRLQNNTLNKVLFVEAEGVFDVGSAVVEVSGDNASAIAGRRCIGFKVFAGCIGCLSVAIVVSRICELAKETLAGMEEPPEHSTHGPFGKSSCRMDKQMHYHHHLYTSTCRNLPTYLMAPPGR